MQLKKFVVTSRPYPQSDLTQEMEVFGKDEEHAVDVHERLYPQFMVVSLKEV